MLASPSDRPVTIAGSSFVTVTLRGIDWLSPQAPGIHPSLPVLRQVVLTEQFEGYVGYTAGLASPVAPVVSVLSGPPRLVVDFRYATPPTLPATGAASGWLAVLATALVGLGLALRRVAVARPALATPPRRG